MNTIHLFRNTTTALLLPLFLIFFISACEENPVEEEEHTDPVGLIVSDGGVEIVRVDRSTVTGTFDVTAGVLSPHYDLEFLDEDGDTFIPDDPDFSPEAIIADPEVVEVVRDEPHDWNFHLRGLKEGTTTVRLGIAHGGHSDYLSPEITIVVMP